MATPSSILAWKMPRTEEPSVHGVAKNWTLLSDFTFFHFTESGISAAHEYGGVLGGISVDLEAES